MKIGALSKISKVDGLFVWRKRTFITLRTKSEATELLALSFTTQIEGVGELALVAFLAEAALVMLADEMADSRSLVWRSVVSIRAGRTKRTVAVLVGSACWAVVLVRKGEGRECCLEIGQEGQLRNWGAGRVEDLISDGSGHVACWTEMDGPAGVKQEQRGLILTCDCRRASRSSGERQIRACRLELDASTLR